MEAFKRIAIEEAEEGRREGGIPIGSVVVHGEKTIGRGHNRRVQRGSVILHTEMDALEVYAAVREAVDRARAGGRPAFIGAKIVRWQGNYEGDPQGYRDRCGAAQTPHAVVCPGPPRRPESRRGEMSSLESEWMIQRFFPGDL